MAKSTTTVVVIVAAVAGLGCLITAALAMFIFGFSASLLDRGDSDWSPDSIAERDLPSVLGVRLPSKPLHYDSRQTGFQDVYLEVLVQLPPGGDAAFLRMNRLGAIDGGVIPPHVDERIHALEPGTPALSVQTLDLSPSLLSDGGVFLYREGEVMLGAGGQVWIHLAAFDT